MLLLKKKIIKTVRQQSWNADPGMGDALSPVGLRPLLGGWLGEAVASVSPGTEAGLRGHWTICPGPSPPHPFLWCWDPWACWAQGLVHGRLAPGVSSQCPGPPWSPHHLSPAWEDQCLICIAVPARLSSIFNDRPRDAVGGRASCGPF